MMTEVKYNGLYNSNYKEAFIETFDEDNARRIQSVGFFRKTAKYEKRYNEDLFNFTPSQLDVLLKSLTLTSHDVAVNTVSILNNYLAWAKQYNHSNLKNTRYIPLSQASLSKYIYKNLNTVYSYDELVNCFNNIKTQYGLIAWLMFYGVGTGKNAFDEIQTLKVEHLYEKNSKFYVNLERKQIEIDEDLFYKLIRYDKITTDSQMMTAYKDSEYIFKALDNKTVKANEFYVKSSVKNRVFDEIKEFLETDRFDTSSIVRNGMNFTVYKMYKELGEKPLGKDNIKEICDIYDKFKTVNGGYYLGKFMNIINVDRIKEIYGHVEFEGNLNDKII